MSMEIAGQLVKAARKEGRRSALREAKAVRDWLIETMKVNRIELEIWRERYPHQAIYIAEEARAKAENREPKYLPPIVIG